MERLRGSSQVVAELDEILVWIADVDADDRSGCARALDRTFLDLDALRDQLGPDLVDRFVDDETEIGAAGTGVCGLRFELAAGLVQVDLAASEGQRPPIAFEGDGPHPQHPLVEVDRRVEVLDGQHQMIQTLHLHLRNDSQALVSPEDGGFNKRIRCQSTYVPIEIA